MTQSTDKVSSYRHLVIVCCHAIWMGRGAALGEYESEWLLESFQEGEGPTFLAHIKAGLELCRRDESAILVFTGGTTKPHATSLSEGQSYSSLAKKLNVVDASRLHVERFATDSMQNLLFSILLFMDVTKCPPQCITIVSHAFKRRRFLEQHCPVLRLPPARVDYIGIDPEKDDLGRQQIEAGEEKARQQWAQDPWGWGLVLSRKRLQRAWSEDCLSELPMQNLVKWDGGSTRKAGFPDALPWEALPSETIDT